MTHPMTVRMTNSAHTTHHGNHRRTTLWQWRTHCIPTYVGWLSDWFILRLVGRGYFPPDEECKVCAMEITPRNSSERMVNFKSSSKPTNHFNHSNCFSALSQYRLFQHSLSWWSILCLYVYIEDFAWHTRNFETWTRVRTTQIKRIRVRANL